MNDSQIERLLEILQCISDNLNSINEISDKMDRIIREMKFK
jgi:hypothetical protein